MRKSSETTGHLFVGDRAAEGADRVAPAHRLCLSLLVLSAALAAICVVAPSAFAVQLHGLQFTFNGADSAAGAFTEPTGLAVDESDGVVYVSDPAHGVLDKFNESGVAQNFAALGSSSLNVAATCSGANVSNVAVDNSAGPGKGNIYVTAKFAEVCAYSSSGEFLWRLTGEEMQGSPCGAAVDSEGHLWVAVYAAGIQEFENTGNPPELKAIVPVEPNQACDVAVDSSNDIDVAFYYNGVDRYTFQGFQNGIEPTSPNQSYVPGGGIALDASTGHVYVANEPFINSDGPYPVKEYTQSGTLVSELGRTLLATPTGVAVNSSTGDVYVSDSSGKVFVFGPLADFASVTTGAAINARRTTAILTGHVDPEGGGDITTCQVEYGTDKSYGNSAPCNEPTPYTAPTDVEANVSGLKAGMTYHYRLSATDASGTNIGADQTFTTPFVSGVKTESASSLDRTSATLNGSLDPDNVSTRYYFQWRSQRDTAIRRRSAAW